ncbi:hypothetical protein DFH07DRAFT_968592 [Mycena maculata]|uniref:Uncharacterized protein n=1 Tax=Mycena maculata TaxID=230809 RepID=A0AAD7MTX5_9AGAR|nr:hypothetical protein DFH07DRAFT_968592 [Mycena maculata]
MKDIFDKYLFVEKFSGTGWDAEDKHATNTEEYIKDFQATHGKKYERCFKTPCPYYSKLNTLFDGMKNRATGEHIVHLGPRKQSGKQSRSRDDSNKENPLQQDTSAATPPLTDTNPRTPMVNLTVMTNEEAEAGSGIGEPYDDELSLSPKRASLKCKRAESDNKTKISPKESRKRQKSDSSSVARRNAEAGTQLSRSILKDKTLLPPDPKGKLFRCVSSALGREPALAHIFILEEDRDRCKGILEGILEEAGFNIPMDY